VGVSDQATFVRLEPPVIASCHVELGFEAASDDDLMFARELAAGLIGERIATLETSRTMRALHPMSTMVFKEEGKVTGVLGALPLRASGLLALATDRFDPVNPDPDQIAPAGEDPLAVYGWGFAATTRRASAAVLNGANLFRTTVFPTIPGFARAATDAGRRVLMGRLGYVPFPRSTTGLLWTPPLQASEPQG
jgi:hypothetical protein